MTDGGEWMGRVGSAWAEEWHRTDRSFGELTRVLLDPTQVSDFDMALDIGCGAGEISCGLAIAYPTARVLGIDISPELLAVARRRGAGIANVRFAEADAASWVHERGHRPELLISRHGVMFFADPVVAFAHLRGQATPGARLRFTCFRTTAENEWVRLLAAAVPLPAVPADQTAPGPFAFGDPARVERILAAAGWGEIAFRPVDFAMIAGEGEGAVEEALSYFRRIGPAARVMAELPERERVLALERLQARLKAHCRDSRVALPAAAWVVTARSP